MEEKQEKKNNYSTQNIAAIILHFVAGFGSVVKNPPAMQETQIQSLCWEDPTKKEMALTPVFLSLESHGQRSLVGFSPRGHKESDMT